MSDAIWAELLTVPEGKLSTTCAEPVIVPEGIPPPTLIFALPDTASVNTISISWTLAALICCGIITLSLSS